MVMKIRMVTTLFRVNSASVPLLLPLKLPALPQPGLHHGLDVHPLQLVQRPVQHVHPRPAQLFFRPPAPLVGSQSSAPELKPLKRGRRRSRRRTRRREICDTKKKKKHSKDSLGCNGDKVSRLHLSTHTAGNCSSSLLKIVKFCQRQSFLKS